MLLLLACTGEAEPTETSALEDTAQAWAEPHRLILLDVGGRLQWDQGWSLKSPGASTGIINSDVEAVGESSRCRASRRDAALTPGVTPIRLSSSLERIAGHWDGEEYDMLGFEGQEVYGPEDRLRAYNDELGLEAEVRAPDPVEVSLVLGEPEGLDTAILDAPELLWTGVWGGDLAVMCAVRGADRLLPDEGQALLGDVEPDAIKLVFANAEVVEGFFDQPVWLIAGRGFDLPPSTLVP